MANKKKLSDEQLKQIKLLKANYEMLEKTKSESKAKGSSSDVLAQIEDAQNDVATAMKNIDTDYADSIISNTVVTTVDDSVKQLTNKREKKKRDTIADKLKKVNAVESTHQETNTNTATNVSMGNRMMQSYDIIELPSCGQCYKSKIDRVEVGYLTAYDENLITSPNLYRDGVVIDVLLKNKVFTPLSEDLCAGDVDAIVLFLRATSYGTDFPVSVRDPKSGKEFDAVVDLSKIKYKEFKLKGDENGNFEFVLPLSKDIVKFRFLTRKDIKNLERIENMETDNGTKTLIGRIGNDLSLALNKDSVLDDVDKLDIKNLIDKLEMWENKLENSEHSSYSRTLTNRLEMQIVSVNGNDDREFIHEYVNNMRAKDAMDLRHYIADNEPGVDFNVDVERPAEFGGGSFKTFLEWNDVVFLNIA